MSGSAQAAAAQAAHDVIVSQLPVANAWGSTRIWLDTQLAADLAAFGRKSHDRPGFGSIRSISRIAVTTGKNPMLQ